MANHRLLGDLAIRHAQLDRLSPLRRVERTSAETGTRRRPAALRLAEEKIGKAIKRLPKLKHAEEVHGSFERLRRLRR